MPQRLQLKIKNAILKEPRLHHGIYEKTAQINGITVCGRSSELTECEDRFLDDLAEKFFTIREGNAFRTSPTMPFPEWAEIWFNQVFKPNVTESTFENEYSRYKRHILPFFGKKTLREISPLDCIQFFNKLKEKGIDRTAEGCYGNLKRIFQFAVESRLIKSSPMASVKPIKNERKNGVPLSKEEERQFLKRLKGMKYETVFILALYTGLRPCEYETAQIEGDFIIAQNRKQKNTKKIVFKKIPISPMLRPYLELIREKMPEWNKLTANSAQRARWQFQELCPGHRMYDLRTTFATRCQECGVPENVVQSWMGHAPRTLLGQVYTKFSDEYLLSEGKKVQY